MSQFKAIAEVARYTRDGKGFEVTGTADEVIGATARAMKSEDMHLFPMASEILENQMKGLKVGGTLAYNWACSVLNVKVERVS